MSASSLFLRAVAPMAARYSAPGAKPMPSSAAAARPASAAARAAAVRHAQAAASTTALAVMPMPATARMAEKKKKLALFARRYASTSSVSGGTISGVRGPNLKEWADVKKNNASGDVGRRAFAYFMMGSMGFSYAAMAKAGVLDFLGSMNAAADVKALANVEVDLGSVAEGLSVTVKYRGKPLFVRHRTEAEIQSALEDDKAELRHVETDAARTKNPKYLVVLGVCTHLGCVPIAYSGDYKGYFCPCHGSHYDTSGRIRKGPAPYNLEVPPYKFVSDDKIIVGVSE